ncbi:hypothetical protein Plhal304r1_c046g0127151 [Plasmopara halstedii]
MAYSSEQYLANKERIKAAQKRYYQRTQQIRVRKRKPKTELIDDKAEPNNETKLNSLFFFSNKKSIPI